mmetsp:Transcript_12136/g.24978  ORF Transcript_12136/g.24978 Transcript_12136/m.24978 type:complete len:957 (-) Transcript_12136:161-3031(-)
MNNSLLFDDANSVNNVLVISLYLIDSEEDIISTSSVNNGVQIHKRALLYSRLCQACTVANDILRSATLSDEYDSGRESTGNTFRSDSRKQEKHHFPWSSGGDGPIFGVHCSLLNDDFIKEDNTSIYGDDLWQSQHSNTVDSFLNGKPSSDLPLHRQKSTSHLGDRTQQPHLRAICRYGNDIADMWRCTSLAIRISQILSSKANNMQCAIECWDVNDGHVLLIEAAEHLPSWVDDDVMQGGVGGPAGCRNRCWIVDGKVHLIPPQLQVEVGSCLISSNPVEKLSRIDALRILIKSTSHICSNKNFNTEASDAVQFAIQTRIGRTLYEKALPSSSTLHHKSSARPDLKTPDFSRHWHVAAVALPAAIARFIQQNPSLVPLLVDSFCKYAPKYLKEHLPKKKQPQTNDPNVPSSETLKSCKGEILYSAEPQSSSESCSLEKTQLETNDKLDEPITSSKLGKNFPYEQIVVIPVTLTRTTYAELVAGRGCVPSFRIPREYRSVELNRFQRQLNQLAYLDVGERNGGNRFRRAVDIGLRLCAGLDWIIEYGDDLSGDGDPALRALGDVERRLRIYWTRIDAEAIWNNDFDTTSTSLSWIEKAWQAGPNEGEYDKVLVQALQNMTKCLVFQPELSSHLWKEPCPITKPGLPLRSIVKSGLNVALQWIRDNHCEDSFQLPREWEVESDEWMEVRSLEDLEAAMKNMSYSTASEDKKRSGIYKSKPRKTTRRSRQKMNQSHKNTEGIEGNSNAEASTDHCDGEKSLNKMLEGFRSFVEGEGELEGAVTNSKNIISLNLRAEIHSPEQLMKKAVNIDPRRFFNTLHTMLQYGIDGSSAFENDTQSDPKVYAADLSKYFFEEDLGAGNISDENESITNESENISLCVHGNALNSDPFSVKNIMHAMDDELRTTAKSHPSIAEVSIASEECDVEVISNLLRSLDAQGDGPGPVSNILREMSICPPRL